MEKTEHRAEHTSVSKSSQPTDTTDRWFNHFQVCGNYKRFCFIFCFVLSFFSFSMFNRLVLSFILSFVLLFFISTSFFLSFTPTLSYILFFCSFFHSFVLSFDPYHLSAFRFRSLIFLSLSSFFTLPPSLPF